MKSLSITTLILLALALLLSLDTYIDSYRAHEIPRFPETSSFIEGNAAPFKVKDATMASEFKILGKGYIGEPYE